MKNIILSLIVVIVAISSIDAQRSRERSRNNDRYENDDALKNKLWYGFSIGNLYISRDFSASAKVHGGYKATNFLSVGLQTKMYYDSFRNRKTFSYGGGPEARLMIGDTFYAIGEFNLLSIQNAQGIRDQYAYPSAGIGYKQGRGPWTGSAQLLFILDSDVTQNSVLNRTVDYWIEFNYNF